MSEPIKQNIPDAGYKILNIALLKSIYERKLDVLPVPNSKINIHLDIDVTEEGNKVVVRIIAHIKLEDEENTYATSQVDYAGIFEKIGEPLINPQDFGHVNGAAMIYPFIREHISSLAAKSGIGILLLPPINFVKLNQEKVNQLPSENE